VPVRFNGSSGAGELGADGVRVEKRPIGRADYVRTLRPLVPAEAFVPYAGAYRRIVVHLAVVVAGWISFRHLPNVWWPPIALVIGNSLAALAFLAHDVSHGGVTQNRYLFYPTELVLWALLYMPATVWRRIHASHHAHTNSDQDPDRRFLPHELTMGARLFSLGFIPNKVLRYNLICFTYFLVYPARHSFTALFYPGASKPSSVSAKPRYTTKDKFWIAGEVAFCGAVQVGIFAIVHKAFFWASFVPVAITSVVVSWYFFTNHSLRPIGDGDDILGATTSVEVPRICNALHSNFSYHTEHHLFPAMNPRFYPQVSALIGTHFPDRYHRIPILAAWTALWRHALAGSRRGDLSPGARRSASPAAAVSAANPGA
jgi:fatty acid desaturase